LSGTGTLWVVFGAPSGHTADVAFDVTGYFVPGANGATYHGLTPNRIVDSRPTGSGHTNTGMKSSLTAGVPKAFTVVGRVPADSTRNVPAGAVAVVGNLTVTGQSALGSFSVQPYPDDTPETGMLRFPVGDNRATGLTLKLAPDGTVSITFTSSTDGAVADVVFDVTGYFGADTSGAMFVPVTPNRIVDSRIKQGLSAALRNHVAATFWVINRTPSNATTNIPTGAVAVTGTLTVTKQTYMGWLALTTAATNYPSVSTLNFPVNDNRATGVTVPLSSTGKLSVTYGAISGATTHVVFDVSGYFVN
jgi:hypothetical protein